MDLSGGACDSMSANCRGSSRADSPLASHAQLSGWGQNSLYGQQGEQGGGFLEGIVKTVVRTRHWNSPPRLAPLLAFLRASTSCPTHSPSPGHPPPSFGCRFSLAQHVRGCYVGPGLAVQLGAMWRQSGELPAVGEPARRRDPDRRAVRIALGAPAQGHAGRILDSGFIFTGFIGASYAM